MRPKGMRSNIFFPAVCLTTNHPLSHGAGYKKLEAEVGGRRSLFLTEENRIEIGTLTTVLN